jgi:hypothetical protein
MPAALLNADERIVIASVDDEGERAFPADLDHAVHSLEQRGWLSLLSRGAVIDGKREYTLALTPHGRMARRELAGRDRRSGARGSERGRRG